MLGRLSLTALVAVLGAACGDSPSLDNGGAGGTDAATPATGGAGNAAPGGANPATAGSAGRASDGRLRFDAIPIDSCPGSTDGGESFTELPVKDIDRSGAAAKYFEDRLYIVAGDTLYVER